MEVSPIGREARPLDRQEPIPRHAEINERLARAILRRASKDSNL